MITITEHEKEYMIAKAKHEARFETLMKIQGELYVKASNIDRLLDSREAMNIYQNMLGTKFARMNQLRNILRDKSRAYYNASGRYFEQAIRESNEWKMKHKVEGLF